MIKSFEFKLSRDEFDVLSNIVSTNEPSLSHALKQAHVGNGHQFSLMCTRSEAARLGNLLTEELAHSGFDEQYLPNERGQILEVLIDKLFTP